MFSSVSYTGRESVSRGPTDARSGQRTFGRIECLTSCRAAADPRTPRSPSETCRGQIEFISSSFHVVLSNRRSAKPGRPGGLEASLDYQLCRSALSVTPDCKRLVDGWHS